MTRPGLNFALVGCGRISKKHAEAFSSVELNGSRLVAVCDVKYDRAVSLGSSLGIPSFRCAHEMIKAHPEIDVLNILSESGLHAQHCLELVKYRKHFVVEKPMALTLRDADSMISACKDAGVRLFVVKQNRYNKPVSTLMRAIKENRFGNIFMVTARVRWSRSVDYYKTDPWRGTFKLDGGVFANQASHYIDLMQAVMGMPEQVFAKGITVSAPIEAEDSGVAIFTSRNVIGTLEATTAIRPRNLEGSLSVLGEFGSVELSGVALNEIRSWNLISSASHDVEVLHASEVFRDSIYGFGHAPFLADVVKAIVSEENVAVEGSEGRKTVEILEAIYESLATGKEISIPSSCSKSMLGRP